MDYKKRKIYGWRFPVGTDPKTGGIAATDLEDDIRQSILILLSTRPGERIGRPGYGCDLLRFTFENVTFGLIKEISAEIQDTLTRWEDRIENICVDAVNENDHTLAFSIHYNIAETKISGEVRYELNIG